VDSIAALYNLKATVPVKFQSLQVRESRTFTSYPPSSKGPRNIFYRKIGPQKPKISGELLLDVTSVSM
jgi:hypothetical protein